MNGDLCKLAFLNIYFLFIIYWLFQSLLLIILTPSFFEGHSFGTGLEGEVESWTGSC